MLLICSTVRTFAAGQNFGATATQTSGTTSTKKNTKGRGALQGPGPIASLNSQIIRGVALARRRRLRLKYEVRGGRLRDLLH